MGALVRQELLNLYTVTKLDKSYDGIMWLNVSAKHSDHSLNICVCYLLPYKSLRVDVEEFLDNFLSHVYVYQKESPFDRYVETLIVGLGIIDYIEVVYDIPERSVLDFESNLYCNKFLDFLISTNCCV